MPSDGMGTHHGGRRELCDNFGLFPLLNAKLALAAGRRLDLVLVLLLPLPARD